MASELQNALDDVSACARTLQEAIDNVEVTREALMLAAEYALQQGAPKGEVQTRSLGHWEAP